MAESGASGVSVAFRTLGCKVNRVESDQIAAELLGRGARIADEEHAQIVVINTCTVTGEADAKTGRLAGKIVDAGHRRRCRHRRRRLHG